MKRPFVVLNVSAALLSLAAAGCVPVYVAGGDVVSETRQVTGFDAVEFSGLGDLEIVQADSYALELTGVEGLVDRIETEVRSGTLYIRERGAWSWWPFGTPDRRLEVRLALPELRSLVLSGAGDVEIDRLAGDEFEFRLSGAGKLSARDLELDSLSVTISGAGSARASGTVDSQTIRISGAGDYDGKDLESREASVDLSGAGKAEVWAEGTLVVRSSGAGTVEYYGEPDVTSDVSGVGTVRDMGRR